MMVFDWFTFHLITRQKCLPQEACVGHCSGSDNILSINHWFYSCSL